VSQDSLLNKKPPKVSFLQRSRDQKAGGWLLTVAGTVGFIATFASHAGQALVSAITLGQTKNNSFTAGYVITGACVASGIYLFTAAARNKRKWKATSVTIGIEKTEVLKYNAVYKNSYPAVGIKIKI
jgi:uncharacterized membrane protein HdeD (DUF308 family)